MKRPKIRMEYRWNRRRRQNSRPMGQDKF